MCCPGWHKLREIARGGMRFMSQTNRLHHDVEIAQRVTLALLADFVLAAFLMLALGVTVYDVGKWLSIW
jgi:hypothetical protein